MTRWKTILVPADFSPTARGALMLACEVARDAQGRIVLLHVAQLPSGLTMESMVRPRAGAELVPVGAYLETAAREELARLAQSARAAWPDVPIEMRVQFGAPSAVILETITSLAPDLVVLGTHGRTGFAHLMLGSVAELALDVADQAYDDQVVGVDLSPGLRGDEGFVEPARVDQRANEREAMRPLARLGDDERLEIEDLLIERGARLTSGSFIDLGDRERGRPEGQRGT